MDSSTRIKQFNFFKNKKIASNEANIEDSNPITAKILNEKLKERRHKKDKQIDANRGYSEFNPIKNEDTVLAQSQFTNIQLGKLEKQCDISSTLDTLHNNPELKTIKNVTKDPFCNTFLIKSSMNSNENEFHFAKPTFISNTRRQMIELWRKRKKEEDEKKDKRPIFKVYHLDPKDLTLELPKLPQSNSFNFKV
jgi:hypothetical protein